MNTSQTEYDSIKAQVLSHLRRKGYYTQPSVRAYPVTIKVLEDLIAAGFVTEHKGYHGKERLFNATSLLPSTVVVRTQFTHNLKAGNHCGHSGEFYATVNERFNEVTRKDFVEVGVVDSVEVKDMPKNLWEKILGRKSERVVFVTLRGGEVIKTPYNTIYQITRPEY